MHRRAAGQAGYSLWLVSADDGRARLLADSAEPSWPLLPQPGGSLLLYATGDFRRAVIDVRSGSRTLLGLVSDAKWSPDGRLVAAVTREGIDVMRPDGSERRTVVSFPPLTRGVSRVRSLDWSPDGKRLAFALGREFPEVPSRFSATVRHEIHTVALDGSGLQQLTGVIGDDAFAGGSLGSIEPSWWPGGSRLFFKRANANAIQTMNADGSCEAPWPGPVGLVYPAWRPGAQVAAGPVECSSIIVRAHRAAAEVSYRDTLRVRITLLNDGTRPLRNVRLLLRTTRGTIDVPGRGMRPWREGRVHDRRASGRARNCGRGGRPVREHRRDEHHGLGVVRGGRRRRPVDDTAVRDRGRLAVPPSRHVVRRSSRRLARAAS